ncbi:MAG: organic solute transporter Ostalpha-domain-containing protein [Monoraphidium minutum]|nr:MAG: organic solute transporter Ostalpha-domain-containing protein [Monoraphidium minutum]
MLKDSASISLAGVCALGAIAISIYQILCHLRNYTEPVFQRYIIRLIFMVPVYAVGSWFSLKYRDAAIYFDTLRDCYEAWIIYNFTSLLLAYVGGPGAVVVKAEGRVVHPSWSHMTCCLPAMQARAPPPAAAGRRSLGVDGFFLRRCKQGTLQFVLLKPVMAALTLILFSVGAYTDGDMSPRNGYFYISILYNICYTFALYGLMLFWIGAAELLKPFNPLLKFILVKTVVFLTFWQARGPARGIVISAINSMGEIRDPEDAKALQNFMICVEMLIAGCAMTFAFPYKQYSIGGSAAAFRLDAFAHAASVSDVLKDVVHVFAPSYSDYVLYSDGGPSDHVKRKKFRGQKGGEAAAAGLVKSMAKNGLAGLDGVLEAAAGGLGVGGRRSGTPKPSASKAERVMERNR